MKKDITLKLNFKNEEARQIFENGVEHWALEYQISRVKLAITSILTIVDRGGNKVTRSEEELTEEEKALVLSYSETKCILKEKQDEIVFNPEDVTGKDLHIIKTIARFSIPGVGYMAPRKGVDGVDYAPAYIRLENAVHNFNCYLATCDTEGDGNFILDEYTKDAFKELRTAIAVYLNDNFGIREEGTLFKSNLFLPIKWHCSATLTWTVSRLYNSVLRVDKDGGKVVRKDNKAGFKKLAVVFGYAMVTGQSIDQTRDEIIAEEKKAEKVGMNKSKTELLNQSETA